MPAIAYTTSGAKQLVAGVAGSRVKLTSCHIQINAEDGTKNVKFQSTPATGSPTDLTGALWYRFTLVPNTDKDGYFYTNPGEDLTLNISGNFSVSGFFEYEFVPYPGP